GERRFQLVVVDLLRGTLAKTLASCRDLVSTHRLVHDVVDTRTRRLAHACIAHVQALSGTSGVEAYLSTFFLSVDWGFQTGKGQFDDRSQIGVVASLHPLCRSTL